MRTAEFFSELKSQNLSQLEESAGVSRQALHNALKSHNMKLDNLTSVAKAMKLEVEFMPRKTEDNLLASLARWGVPVAHSNDGNLELEDVVEESLKRARKDGAYESFVPYLLVQNANKLNPLKLAARGFSSNQVNVLGYFTEMAHNFRPHPNFEKLLELLTVAKSPQQEFLVVSNKSNFPELFQKNQHALNWNLLVRGSVQDHTQRWEKWARFRRSVTLAKRK